MMSLDFSEQRRVALAIVEASGSIHHPGFRPIFRAIKDSHAIDVWPQDSDINYLEGDWRLAQGA
jgi:hypothetical protein